MRLPTRRTPSPRRPSGRARTFLLRDGVLTVTEETLTLRERLTNRATGFRIWEAHAGSPILAAVQRSGSFFGVRTTLTIGGFSSPKAGGRCGAPATVRLALIPIGYWEDEGHGTLTFLILERF